MITEDGTCTVDSPRLLNLFCEFFGADGNCVHCVSVCSRYPKHSRQRKLHRDT